MADIEELNGRISTQRFKQSMQSIKQLYFTKSFAFFVEISCPDLIKLFSTCRKRIACGIHDAVFGHFLQRQQLYDLLGR